MENAIRLGRGAFKKECKNMKIIVFFAIVYYLL